MLIVKLTNNCSILMTRNKTFHTILVWKHCKRNSGWNGNCLSRIQKKSIIDPAKNVRLIAERQMMLNIDRNTRLRVAPQFTGEGSVIFLAAIIATALQDALHGHLVSTSISIQIILIAMLGQACTHHLFNTPSQASANRFAPGCIQATIRRLNIHKKNVILSGPCATGPRQAQNICHELLILDEGIPPRSDLTRWGHVNCTCDGSVESNRF